MPDLEPAFSLPRPAARAAPGAALSCLVCRVGEHEIGLELGSVLEVQPGVTSSPLPGARPPLIGLTVVRGALVPVFDLGAALGLRPSVMPPRTPAFVVLRDGARWAAAVVDAVGDIVEATPGPWQPPGAGLPPAGVLRGAAARGAPRLWLVDVGALLRAPSTGLVAPSPVGAAMAGSR